jgi:hypothetical protein
MFFFEFDVLFLKLYKKRGHMLKRQRSLSAMILHAYQLHLPQYLRFVCLFVFKSFHSIKTIGVLFAIDVFKINTFLFLPLL